MLDHGYEHKVVQLKSQKYLIFPVVDKPAIGIAWPTVSGKLDGVTTSADTVFDAPDQLQLPLLQKLNGSTIRLLMVPRYAD